jgi:two-component system chemotaxis response regulator CheY
MRVLIVDDSRLARLMLRKALPPELDRCDVTEATDGEQALRWIATNDVDLMFLDLTMPDQDGFQVLTALKASGRLPPTIVVSADAQTLAAERALQLGALAFVKKSLKPAELSDVLRRAGVL